MAPFYGRGSTTSRLEPLRGGSYPRPETAETPEIFYRLPSDESGSSR